jgi:hypothetical protein
MYALQLAIVGLSLVPVETIADDRLDVVHHNCHYAEDGRLLIEQVWWEEWRSENSQHAIIGWRLDKPHSPRSPIPLRNAVSGQWESIWLDGDVLRRVRARSFRQSWTQGRDPELADRDRHPDWRATRRELASPDRR